MLGLVLFLLCWYFISFLTHFPYPHIILLRFLELLIIPESVLGKTLLQHTAASLCRVLVASAFAFSFAIPLGILSGWSRKFRSLFLPIIDSLRPIPPLAWIPLAYIIFARIPNTILISQLFIVFIGAFFPCFISVYDSARNTPKELIEMARVFNADNKTVLLDIILPHSLQGISTGIRVGLAVGWMCIIAAEMIATTGEGLGYFILVMYEVGGRVTEIVSGIAMIGIVGYALNNLLLSFEKVIIRWR
ncbi:nitrate ABC transporter permease [Archaeoglobales archaeon ex4484_92]|nr:MAG: nitrate ABC transporter permease [Archaeoglobales archaeon ex4484_92]